MSENIRKLTEEMINAQQQLVNWQIEQSKLAEKQLSTAFDHARTSLRLSRDLAKNVTTSFNDTFVPTKEQAQP